MSPAVDVDTVEPWKEKSDTSLGNCGLCRPSSIAWLCVCLHPGMFPAEMQWFRWAHLELVVRVTSAAEPGTEICTAYKSCLVCVCLCVRFSSLSGDFLCPKGHRITLSRAPLWCLCWTGVLAQTAAAGLSFHRPAAHCSQEQAAMGCRHPSSFPWFYCICLS